MNTGPQSPNRLEERKSAEIVSRVKGARLGDIDLALISMGNVNISGTNLEQKIQGSQTVPNQEAGKATVRVEQNPLLSNPGQTTSTTAVPEAVSPSTSPEGVESDQARLAEEALDNVMAIHNSPTIEPYDERSAGYEERRAA